LSKFVIHLHNTKETNEFIMIWILLKGYKIFIQPENNIDCKVAYKKTNMSLKLFQKCQI